MLAMLNRAKKSKPARPSRPAVRSTRLAPEDEAWLIAEAAWRGLSPSATLAMLVREGRQRDEAEGAY